MFQKKESARSKRVPANTSVQLSIEGLAFCKLKPKISKINFLSHVPFHKLDMEIIQKRRGTEKEIFKFSTRIEPGHTISIKTENALVPAKVSTDGDYPLSKLINISELHKVKINDKNYLPEKLLPIVLTVADCAFYTEQMTPDDFDIIETDETTGAVIIDRKKIGYAMGGNIKCRDTGGSFTLEVKGAQATKITRPLRDADGDFVFHITFNNHCSDIAKCREMLQNDSDFRFYYDLLEDSKNPNRKFKILKSAPDAKLRSVDIAICNVIIVEPSVTH